MLFYSANRSGGFVVVANASLSSPIVAAFDRSFSMAAKSDVERNLEERLNVKSEYFIGDFLRIHGARIEREGDVRQIVTYHSDNNDWSIAPECKDQLLAKLMKVVRSEGEQIHNRVFLDVIRDWYHGLDATSKIENTAVAADHLNSKGQSIARMIMEANHRLGQGSEFIRLLDVGGNDGKLTSYVASHIADYQNSPVHPYVLEVETGISWDHNSHEVVAAPNGRNPSVKTIYYDGGDMASGRVSGEHGSNPLLDGIGFDCVMYQHSLHHFPSSEVQQQSLIQTAGLLKEGGVLTVSEHSSALGGAELDLMHMVTEIYSDLHRDPDMSGDELEARYNAYVEKETPANYFSKTNLMDMAQKAGLTPVSATAISMKAERTYSITFVKSSAEGLDRDRSLDALIDSDALKAGVPKYVTAPVSGLARSLDGGF
ncbi:MULTISPECIES: methyltransferase domain-containing protein [Pseudomonas]|uniref:methyltransferase domain-containing protein n=1 Tax=Pseudomonas TaxID=286 RepID=UPI001BEA6491|nr:MULTISPECIES: methyltransferase domain-containing protein [Pseudomonas]MBT2339702.1 methyltransferase domain-containing protein [Pseudomonas fluorescens]MCD4531224.1 methyltransferase domain-containing protein [Pseudomonas sp. C3-2018]